MLFKFDVIVIGAGHAGSEASYVSAKLGVKTLLLTDNIFTIGKMSCNPSVGGVGKGHLVREVDALGGLMGFAADCSGIFFKTLNTSKGCAAQATRVQVDPFFYQNIVMRLLSIRENLYMLEATVDDVLVKNGCTEGVKLTCGVRIYSNCVVVTTGTFLNGIARAGSFMFKGGRVGDITSSYFFLNLRKIFKNVCRFKTGTPPRVFKDSINYLVVEKQYGDIPVLFFSKYLSKPILKQEICFLTETNIRTHSIVMSNLHKSAFYKGKNISFGPRYCLSIEDKVLRFDKEGHHIFLEYDGKDLNNIYLNGLSTSAPLSVQYNIIRSIKGLENAEVNFPGYLIEYDCFDPKDLTRGLETAVNGLFFAGQINGTTGYEEAASQGVVCGINAARHSNNESLWEPSEVTSFIGVLIKDLTYTGVTEPYRIFTSRSNNRLSLREDNTEFRLAVVGKNFKAVSDLVWLSFKHRYINFYICYGAIQLKEGFFSSIFITFKQYRNIYNIILKKVVVGFITKRIGWYFLIWGKCTQNKLFIDILYNGYIVKKGVLPAYDKLLKFGGKLLYDISDYSKITGLSKEAIEKLNLAQPYVLKQVYSISGITFVDIFTIFKFLCIKS